MFAYRRFAVTCYQRRRHTTCRHCILVDERHLYLMVVTPWRYFTPQRKAKLCPRPPELGVATVQSLHMLFEWL
jgi:hypothetical protein